MIAKVTTAETTSEPKQPMRLLKNKNTGNTYPLTQRRARCSVSSRSEGTGDEVLFCAVVDRDRFWMLPGFGDYLCHRSSKIERTSVRTSRSRTS
jgi:hypothetical protein